MEQLGAISWNSLKKEVICWPIEMKYIWLTSPPDNLFVWLTLCQSTASHLNRRGRKIQNSPVHGWGGLNKKPGVKNVNYHL